MIYQYDVIVILLQSSRKVKLIIEIFEYASGKAFKLFDDTPAIAFRIFSYDIKLSTILIITITLAFITYLIYLFINYKKDEENDT